MGEFKPASWYDDVYASEPNLTADPYTSTFGPLWLEMAGRVPDNARVIEIGCGAGQLAALILPRIESYLGLDFSMVALEAACRLSSTLPPPPGERIFMEHEITDQCIPVPRWNPTLILACEVLEHLDGDNDQLVFRQFKGVPLLASLPMGDSASHVRHFPGSEDVMSRYGQTVIDPVIAPFDQWYILEGIIR